MHQGWENFEKVTRMLSRRVGVCYGAGVRAIYSQSILGRKAASLRVIKAWAPAAPDVIGSCCERDCESEPRCLTVYQREQHVG